MAYYIGSRGTKTAWRLVVKTGIIEPTDDDFMCARSSRRDWCVRLLFLLLLSLLQYNIHSSATVHACVFTTTVAAAHTHTPHTCCILRLVLLIPLRRRRRRHCRSSECDAFARRTYSARVFLNCA